MARVDYLAGYPAELRAQVQGLQAQGRLLPWLQSRYPDPPQVTNNAQLYAYAQDLKRTHMKSSPPLGKVRFCEKISTLHRAFGLHTYATRVQGRNLKRRNEVRISALFRELPPEFLRMVVVHELAHLRHRDHDRAFYRLCEHMEPDYAQLELDLRLWCFARQQSPP